MKASKKSAQPKPVAAIEPIIQKNIGDCAVATFAMISGVPYRLVSEAALRVDNSIHTTGMYNDQIEKLAKKLKIKIRYSKKWPEDATGILILDAPGHAHAVALFEGIIVDPQGGLIWDYDSFLTTNEWKAVGLFEVL